MSKFKISSEEMWHEINAQHGDSGGAYILKCDSGNGSPIPVDRLLSKDLDGILYIGKASSFLNRVADLKKSISPEYKSGSHECGSRFKQHSGISAAFPYESLYLNLVEDTEPRAVESTLLKEYEDKFGELPPLNRVS